MRALLLLLLLFGTATGSLFAADPVPFAVHCLSPAQQPADWKNPTLSVFANQPLKFDAQVTAPLGSKLAIYADLYQTSAGGWAVPLSKGLRLAPDLQFDTSTQLLASCSLPPLPAVRAPTRMRLKLSLRAAPGATRPAGAVDLVVYPQQKPGQWKKLFAAAITQSGLAKLVVFGKGASLRGFLHQQQVPFEDLGAAWPATLDPRNLYLADSPPSKSDHPQFPPGFHIAIFLSDPTDSPALPGIYSAADATGSSVVKVTLSSLLDRLDEDPRNQQTFLEIVHQTLQPQSSPTDPAIPLIQ